MSAQRVAPFNCYRAAPLVSEWTEDVCTCKHSQSKHRDTYAGPWMGVCKMCQADFEWSGMGPVCGRYQWNGEPRKKVW